MKRADDQIDTSPMTNKSCFTSLSRAHIIYLKHITEIPNTSRRRFTNSVSATHRRRVDTLEMIVVVRALIYARAHVHTPYAEEKINLERDKCLPDNHILQQM